MSYVWVNIIDGGYNGENTFGGVFSSPQKALEACQGHQPSRKFALLPCDYPETQAVIVRVKLGHVLGDYMTYEHILGLERFELDNLDANGFTAEWYLPKEE